MGTRGHRENGDPTHRQFDPRTLEFSCSLEQFNAIILQFIASYSFKKASCLHYYHSSVDLHDNFTPKEFFSISLVSRATLKSWVWSGVRAEINFTLFLIVDLSALEKSSVCLPMRSDSNVIMNLAARESCS